MSTGRIFTLLLWQNPTSRRQMKNVLPFKETVIKFLVGDGQVMLILETQGLASSPLIDTWSASFVNIAKLAVVFHCLSTHQAWKPVEEIEAELQKTFDFLEDQTRERSCTASSL